MLYWPSAKPRMVILPPSDRPGPFGLGRETMEGAKVAMVVKSPTLEAASSMNLRVMIACGSVWVSDARTGATAVTGVGGAVTSTCETSGTSVGADTAAA